MTRHTQGFAIVHVISCVDIIAIRAYVMRMKWNPGRATLPTAITVTLQNRLSPRLVQPRVASARAACTRSTNANSEVIAGQWMPNRTMCAPRVVRRDAFSSATVLLIGNSFEVRRPHTNADSAQMIDDQAIRDRAIYLLP